MQINEILEKKVDYSDETDNYKSHFNFNEFEITDISLIADLTNKEEKIIKNINMIQKNTFEFSKTLYETQKLLSNHKNGIFTAWFNNLGLTKNVVYRAIDKYELLLRTENKKVLELPYRVVDILKKSDLPDKEINKIIETENPKEIIEKIRTDSNICTSTTSIAEQIQRLEIKRSKLYEQIQEIEKQIALYSEQL